MITYRYVYIEDVENIAIKLLQLSQLIWIYIYIYIIIIIIISSSSSSSICFIVINLRSSIKSPKLKMLDDCVHNMVMSLNLNKFPLSLSTHQNLFKLF